MKSMIVLGAFALLFCGFRVSSRAAQISLEGSWVGEFRLANQSRFTKVNFKTEKEGIKATIDLPTFSSSLTSLDLKRVSFDSSHVHFELDGSSGRLVFDGQLKTDEISGEVRQGEARGTFQLLRLARIEPQHLAKYYGSYQVQPNRFIWIGKFGEFGADQFFLDSESGRFGPIYPSSETTFFSGQTIMSPFFPVDVKISFTKDKGGEVTGLTYSQSGLPDVSATKIRLKREEVSFHNGDVTLAGKLTAPWSKGPHPAVVLIHGSGPEDRDYMGPWIDFFARQGVAVLSYDKRGVHDSTGDWKRAGFEDLAEDVIAGVQLLKRRKDINSKQIGLWGISQGGWIAPLAASRSNDIAFIILHAGAGVPVAQNGLMSIEYELRAYGFPEEEIKRSLAYYKLNDDVTRSGEGWDKLLDAYQQAKARNAEWLIEEPQPKDSWFRQMYRRVMDFDPQPLWEKITCPVLAFFGELDWTVPAVANRTALDNALRRAGNKDYTIIVLPKANHVFLQAETGVRTEYPHLKNFVANYFKTMADWLLKRVNVKT
ncbi:MAG TPA: alpha/beta fold hydrolase [Pyrinomonadaceae bacterium]